MAAPNLQMAAGTKSGPPFAGRFAAASG